MRTKIILLTLLMVFSGCGSSSDGKSKSKTNTSVRGQGIIDRDGNLIRPQRPGSLNPNENPLGVSSETITNRAASFSLNGARTTPLALGKDPFFSRTELYLAFEKAVSGSVIAQGELALNRQVGSSSCQLPVGRYEISTITAGRQRTVVNSYEGLVLQARGPVSFTARLKESISFQNSGPDGRWVLHAILTVDSVDSARCSLPMSFNAPLEGR